MRLREEAERVQRHSVQRKAALERLAAARATVAEVLANLPAEKSGQKPGPRWRVRLCRRGRRA